MQVVTIKFQEDVLKKIDKSINEHNFNSRTEFIREAVRDKLALLSKDAIMQEFLKFHGKSKNKMTYEDNLKTKDAVGKQLVDELSKRYS